MPTDIRDVVMVAGQPGGGPSAVVSSFVLRANDFASCRWRDIPVERLVAIPDAGDFATVRGGGDGEGRQAAVDTDPTATICVGAGWVPMGRVQIGCLYIQRHPPAPCSVADRGIEDLGASLGQ